MLQPSQLEDVSVRYADEIAEMSEFFTTAGVAVEKPQALAQVVQRLRDDRGFHRDLTSHVWVMLHRRGSEVRYGETLGVVALAAAGKQLAADADEDVAHKLLRFVMEAHDGLNPPTLRTDLPLPVIASVESIAPVRKSAVPVEELPGPVAEVVKSPAITQFPAVSREPMHVEAEALAPVESVEIPPARPVLDTPIRFSRVDAETADGPRSKSSLWVGLAAVLVLAALVGGWFYRNTSAAPEAVATPAPVIDGNATPAPATPAVKQPVPEIPAVEPTPSEPRPSAPSRNIHSSRAVAPSHRQPVPARQMHVLPSPARVTPAAPQQVASVAPPPAVISRPPAAPAPTSASSAPIVRSSATPQRSTAPATVSAGTLSKQLDRPGLTPEQEAEYDATGRRYPHLLRRTPLNNSDTLMAKANVAPSFGGANIAVASTSAGTVRPTSLGVMSSNLIYSPAATYPQAASAAHVEGAVKVEAVVDTSGNVAAARVISGPPQLRDAALNAVQQWRYKPYVLGGKARQFTTQALMEFELQ